MKINKFNLPTIYTRVIDNFNLGNLYPKPSTYLKNCKKNFSQNSNDSKRQFRNSGINYFFRVTPSFQILISFASFFLWLVWLRQESEDKRKWKRGKGNFTKSEVWISSFHLIRQAKEKDKTIGPEENGLTLLNSLHTNINIHILHTVIHTFSKRLKRRICVTIKSCFSWWSSPLISGLSCLIQGWYGKEKLDVSHSWGQRVDIESSVCLSKRERQNYRARRKWVYTA